MILLVYIYINEKLLNGTVNDDDISHALALLKKKECDMNHGQSCGMLGTLLREDDLQIAKQLLKSCDLGDPYSCNNPNLESQQN